MGFLSKDDPPAPPDYTGLAKQQGQDNIKAALIQSRLSNPNVINPMGTRTVTWGNGAGAPPTPRTFDQTGYDKALAEYNAGGGSQVVMDGQNYITQPRGAGGPAPNKDDFWTGGGGGDPTDPSQYNATITDTLSPVGQSLFDQQLRLSQGMGNAAEAGLSRVNDSFSKPFDTSGLPGMTWDVNTGGWNPSKVSLNSNFQGGPQTGGVQMDVGSTTNKIQGQLGPAGAIQSDLGPAGTIQRNLDFSGAPGMPQVNEGARQQVIDAMFGQAKSRLDPMWEQNADKMRSDLVSRGFSLGNEAYEKQQGIFDRGRNDAYQTAMNNAITAGGQEQSRLFGMDLSARQQAVGEESLKGNFANAAQQQQFNQVLQSGVFKNQAQAQEFAQLVARGTFANTAQAQEYAQLLASGQFHNAAQGQDYTQRANTITMNNAATSAGNATRVAETTTNNQAQEQLYQQQLKRAMIQNQARQAGISEEAYMRMLPLQELNALRTGAQPAMPSFPGWSGAGVTPAPTLQGGMLTGQAEKDIFNMNAAQDKAAMDAITSLFGSFMGGGLKR